MKKDIRQTIFDKYDGRCAYCGYPLEKVWHVDHLLPLERDPFTGKHKYP